MNSFLLQTKEMLTNSYWGNARTEPLICRVRDKFWKLLICNACTSGKGNEGVYPWFEGIGYCLGGSVEQTALGLLRGEDLKVKATSRSYNHQITDTTCLIHVRITKTTANVNNKIITSIPIHVTNYFNAKIAGVKLGWLDKSLQHIDTKFYRKENPAK